MASQSEITELSKCAFTGGLSGRTGARATKKVSSGGAGVFVEVTAELVGAVATSFSLEVIVLANMGELICVWSATRVNSSVGDRFSVVHVERRTGYRAL